ncbi:MAG: PIG-L family deacetylase [Lachnospiraceae bacterium]|nr:PIG-L family deacetylase [Lachnospiraceae bacterium]
MRILVVSPHPDDETLGAGGTLLKMKKEGHQIFWLNITDIKLEDGWEDARIQHRQSQIEAIRSFFGFDGFFNLKYPPTRLRGLEEGELIASIRSVFEVIKPEWLMIPGQYDAHSDHHVVYNCCMACAKSFRAPYIRRITTMEILSETEQGYQFEKFSPNLFVDISNEMEGKLEAMRIYDTEIEDTPFPRNIDGIQSLARFRGGRIFVDYAEAFCCVLQKE